MANRFPLVIDTTDGNKIKELPSGDNLNLRESSIVNVQDVTALGTINAADITVNGERLVAQNFADLTDTPSSFVGAADYFVKVKEDGTGLEFRPFSDIGNIEVEQIEVSDILLPTQAGTVDIGSNSLYFRTVVADEFKGDLISSDDTRVFEAATGKISYAALQGAPTSLSEFTDDIGFLRTEDLDDSLFSLFDEGVPFATDIKGSVFGDDSTLLVDGVASKIVGDIDFGATTGFIEGDDIVILPTDGYAVSIGTAKLLDTLTPELAQGGAIGTEDLPFNEANFVTVNADNVSIDAVNQGTGLGVAQISTSTDLSINAGNRVKIDGAVPFKLSSVSSAERLAITPQFGDTIYNSSTGFVEFYQEEQWISLHQGTFTGNVTTATGESNFNNVVVAGNLTVSGTTTTVDTENTTISDNVIVLNNGESGAGVTAGTSGIEIDRGTEANKTFVWDDSVDKWTLGSETLVAATVEAAFTGVLGGVTPAAITGTTIDGTTITATTGFVGNITGDASGAHTGTFDGEVTGSVFGDDSTILVDGVAGKVVGDVENTEVITTTVQGRASAALNIYRGTGGTVSLGDASSGDVTVSDSGINITSTGGVAVNGAVGATVSIGTGGSTGDVTIGKAGNTTTIDGTFNATLTGDVVGNLTGNVAGNVTGNIDNTTLNIGTTDATAINIGNDSSAIVMDGTLQLNSALIVNNLIADDRISITTADGDGNGISLGPQGTNTAVNLTADSIRFFGPVTTEIQATGGIIGDLKGSIVGDDSTILVDAVNNSIPYAVLNGAPTALSDFSNDLDYAAIVGDTIALNGLPVDTFMTGDLDAQSNNIENANLVSATGQLTGDVTGSVFSDDSSVMVDAVNFAMFTDIITLTPLNSEPENITNGMVAIADGNSWDPLSTGVQTMMVYLDSAWRQIATA